PGELSRALTAQVVTRMLKSFFTGNCPFHQSKGINWVSTVFRRVAPAVAVHARTGSLGANRCFSLGLEVESFAVHITTGTAPGHSDPVKYLEHQCCGSQHWCSRFFAFRHAKPQADFLSAL